MMILGIIIIDYGIIVTMELIVMILKQATNHKYYIITLFLTQPFNMQFNNTFKNIICLHTHTHRGFDYICHLVRWCSQTTFHTERLHFLERCSQSPQGMMFAMIGMAMNTCLAEVHVCGASFRAVGRRENGYTVPV